MLIGATNLFAQQNVGIGTTTPDAQAILDVRSTTKGALLPRMTTTQKNNLGASLNNSDEGMLVFDTTIETLYFWDGAAWVAFAAGDHQWIDTDPDGIYYTAGNVAIGTSPSASANLNSFVGTTGAEAYAGLFSNFSTGTTSKYGIYSTVGSQATGNKYGLYTSTTMNTAATGESYGTFNYVTGSSASQEMFGSYSYMNGTTTGRKYGQYTRILSSSAGNQYGTYTELGSATTATRYGSYNEISGGTTGTRFGTYNDVEGGSAQTSALYGSYNRLSGGTSGIRYGSYSTVAGGSSQSSTIYGMYAAANPGSSQTGASYGGRFTVSSAGTNGTKYGIYSTSYSSSTQTFSNYGLYAFGGGHVSGSNDNYGIAAIGSTSGSGRNIAMYANMNSTASNRWAVYANNGNAYFDDDVRIGHEDDVPGYSLSVNGKVICEELRVELDADWPDYVFAKDYHLKSLSEVEEHISEHKHLPGIPSAAKIKDQGGVDVGEMNRKLLEKVEELTLYLIEQNKEIQALKSTVKELQK